MDKLAGDYKKAVRKLGKPQATVFFNRLADLRAADNLETMTTLPGHIHALKGDRAGTFTLYLKHPSRLIIISAVDPPPELPGGGLDWSRVDHVCILEIVDDYH